MKKFIYIVLFFVLSWICSCTVSKPAADRYINNDSTSIFSTHPSRPFKYGYAYDKKECHDNCREYIEDFELKNGDVVADVGAASGWVEGIISTETDSITFYVEDIDTNFSNQQELDKVVKYYSSLRNRPQTNKFYLVTGTGKRTNLPDNTFNKIILISTFHEMSNVNAMLKDIYKKLTPDGKLYIKESFSSRHKTFHHKGCGIKAYKVRTVKNMLLINGFYLVKMTEPENSYYNCLVFSKKEFISNEYDERREFIEASMGELESLHEIDVMKDSLKTKEIARSLKGQMQEIEKVYSTLENYINFMGNDLIKEDKILEAVNIYKINTLLYPKSSLSYINIGDAFLKYKMYDEAVDNYNMALKLDPDDKDVKNKIDELQRLLKK